MILLLPSYITIIIASSNGFSNGVGNNDTNSSEEMNRFKRKVNGKYYIEALVVVDKSFHNFHRQDWERLAALMMETSANVFRDPSLEASIELVVTGIFKIEDESNGPKILEDDDTLLRGFCVWQENTVFKIEGKVVQYDVAILLTRQICSETCDILGITYRGQVCRSWSMCTVIQDIGLGSAYTIAHELGHLLSMYHDEDGKCSEYKNLGIVKKGVMAASSYESLKNWLWSKCSAKFLEHFITKHRNGLVPECLRNKPDTVQSIHEKHNIIAHSAGQIYNITKQCQMVFGRTYVDCYPATRLYPEPPCRNLYCRNQRGSICKYGHNQWFDGTACGKGKWCQKAECVDMPTTTTKSYEPVTSPHKSWTKWGRWSPCSNDCGGGVKRTRRSCLDKKGEVSSGCEGRRTWSMRCHEEPCDTDGVFASAWKHVTEWFEG